MPPHAAAAHAANRRGFTLTDLAACVATFSVVAAIAQPTFMGTRRAAYSAVSADNLAWQGAANAMYGLDNDGALPQFSWKAGETYEVAGRPAAAEPETNQDASQFQLLDIMRRLTSRADGADRIRKLNIAYVDRHWNHMVLADYLGDDDGILERVAVPADATLIGMQMDPENDAARPEAFDILWTRLERRQHMPFTSSYRTTASTWSDDFSLDSTNPVPGPDASTVWISTASDRMSVDRSFDEVRFPANKAYIFEWFDWNTSGRELFFGFEQANPLKIMFDGSVNNWSTGDAVPAFDPNNPLPPPPEGDGEFESPRSLYLPIWASQPDNPDAIPRTASNNLRFTRGGLLGIDYVGPPME